MPYFPFLFLCLAFIFLRISVQPRTAHWGSCPFPASRSEVWKSDGNKKQTKQNKKRLQVTVTATVCIWIITELLLCFSSIHSSGTILLPRCLAGSPGFGATQLEFWCALWLTQAIGQGWSSSFLFLGRRIRAGGARQENHMRNNRKKWDFWLVCLTLRTHEAEGTFATSVLWAVAAGKGEGGTGNVPPRCGTRRGRRGVDRAAWGGAKVAPLLHIPKEF